MTMHADLLRILVCPDTKQPLKPAPAALVERLNARIARGVLKNRGGQLVQEALEGGLLREDGRFLYPIRHEIPVMLIDEAISLEGAAKKAPE